MDDDKPEAGEQRNSGERDRERQIVSIADLTVNTGDKSNDLMFNLLYDT